MSMKLRLIYNTIMQYFPIVLILFGFQVIASANWIWWVVCLITIFVMNVYGFGLGFHHTFAHQTFQFKRPVEIALMYIGTCATLVAPLTWSIAHAAHHRYVDTENDPHSPSHLGWKILFYYNHNTTKPSLLPVRRLLKDRAHLWFDSNIGYWTTVLSLPVISFLIGGLTGLIFIWAIPTFYVLWTGIVFALAHDDDSSTHGHKAKNSLLLGILSFGDGDHQTHHSNWSYNGWIHRQCAKLLYGKRIAK